MAIQVPTKQPSAEREMTIHQRGLVDTGFEENNYQAGISALDRLRHRTYKPYPQHIRLLLYLALYPSAPVNMADYAAENLDTMPSSPSKFAARQRSANSPTLAATEAAQDVLRRFTQTNSPESICRALPNYGVHGLAGMPEIHSIPDNDASDGDSDVAKWARRIREAKSCWEILKDGYIVPHGVDMPSRRANRRRTRKSATGDPFDSDEGTSERPKPVAEGAWPVLELLLALFEKEESLIVTQHDIRYSPHVLAQLPSSRSPSGARWEVDAPLDIVFCCLHIPDRSNLGVRLLTLLINLTSTIHLDLTMFLNAMRSRLRTLSAQDMETLFTRLPPTIACLRFQIALFRLCLADSPGNGDRKTLPRPQAKTAPRPLMKQASATSSALSSSKTDSEAASFIRKFAPIPVTEIIRLFTTSDGPLETDTFAVERRLQMKFLLVLAFGELQQLLGPTERDPEWAKIVQDGALVQSIELAFAHADGAMQGSNQALAKDLQQLLTVASMGWCR